MEKIPREMPPRRHSWLCGPSIISSISTPGVMLIRLIPGTEGRVVMMSPIDELLSRAGVPAGSTTGRTRKSRVVLPNSLPKTARCCAPKPVTTSTISRKLWDQRLESSDQRKENSVRVPMFKTVPFQDKNAVSNEHQETSRHYKGRP